MRWKEVVMEIRSPKGGDLVVMGVWSWWWRWWR